MLKPSAGLDGPSREIDVTPIPVPETIPEQPEPEPAPKEPVKEPEPEKVPA